jgi:flagellar export protein FliJ
MAFHFRLQPLLRLRQSLEERERLRLTLILSAINQLRLQCERLDHDAANTAQDLCKQLATGMTAADVQLVGIGIVSSRHRKELLLQKIAAMTEQRNHQERAFRDAQRRRKVLERLRDLQLEAYKRDQGRREQQRLDDEFGLRRARLAEPSQAPVKPPDQLD